ncbi:hypothetical protein EJ04DRAFT_529176 [Polyplosphaeria fusca]|uniref:RING-type E3 ubiquitin transferase n=1 Tax=Polyplosphaeria fusca TaxID=682080 RepID=A0A9P4QI70_9PLEO|nr:hypothetical protein EJ04DRAFT_529176 [Polyplosphaeria fusca]
MSLRRRSEEPSGETWEEFLRASPSRRRPPSMPRRESDLVLPGWQPDGDVAQCPVCSRHFTFLFRKHHCRKCGRVVCAHCSPHRITIPRQYIVRPPLDDDNDGGIFNFEMPSGGEEVRVCNPCVPDPNYSPPPQYHPTAANRASYHHSSSGAPFSPDRPASRTNRSSRSASDASHLNRRPVHSPPISRGPLPSSFHADANHPRPAFHHSSHSLPRAPEDYPPVHLRHRSRTRVVAEEDECPICLHELPPKGSDGNTNAREAHIMDCWREHEANKSTPAAPRTNWPHAVPIPTPTLNSHAHTLDQLTRGPSPASAPAAEPSAGPSNRESLSRYRMFTYTGTEKDCVDDEGNAIECVICLEDFGAGDKLARLMCFCKFHEVCIKQWWDTKGRGSCPTHQLHD